MSEQQVEGYVAEADRIAGVRYCAGGWPESCICGAYEARSTIYGWLWYAPQRALPQAHAECACGCELTLTRPPFGRPVVRALAAAEEATGGE